MVAALILHQLGQEWTATACVVVVVVVGGGDVVAVVLCYYKHGEFAAAVLQPV
jgi:hypothetical protein